MNKDLFAEYFLKRTHFRDVGLPVITLLFHRLPSDGRWQRQLDRINRLEPLRNEAQLELDPKADQSSHLLGTVRFNQHVIDLAGANIPLSDEAIEFCVWSTPWAVDFKELAASHQAHLHIVYTGVATDPIEQYIALYKVALLFNDDHTPPLAILNEPAWTAHPFAIAPKIMHSTLLPTLRESPPVLFWNGLLEADVQGEKWIVSQGFRLFGLPELAYSTTHEVLAADDPTGLLQDMFHYLYFYQRNIQAGDGIDLGDQRFISVRNLEPDEQFLQDQATVLVLEPLDAELWEALAEADQE